MGCIKVKNKEIKSINIKETDIKVTNNNLGVDQIFFSNKNEQIYNDFKSINNFINGFNYKMYEAEHVLSGKKRFIIAKDDTIMTQKEINLLKSISHPNILKYIECYTAQNKRYLIFEHFKDSITLFDLLCIKGPFSEEVSLKILREILLILSLFHSKKLILNIFSIGNILISRKDMTIKFFNLESVIYQNKDILNDTFFFNQIESLIYAYTSHDNHSLLGCAPEMFSSKISQKSDIWSCGIILYALLCKEFPFKGVNESDLIQNIKQGNLKFLQNCWKLVSPSTINLIEQMLSIKEYKRISLEIILSQQLVEDQVSRTTLKEAENFLQKVSVFVTKNKFQRLILSYLTHIGFATDKQLKYNEVFKLIDIDRDGRISREDAIILIKNCLAPIEALIQTEMFMNLDSDNDGFVSYTDFLKVTIDKKSVSEVEITSAFEFYNSEAFTEYFSDYFASMEFKSSNDTKIYEKITKNTKISFTEFKSIMNDYLLE